MSRRIFLSLVLSLFAMLTLAEPARAENPSGTWKSDSGNTFIVPLIGAGAFDFIKVAPTGAKELVRGSWVAGMEGTQFVYSVGAVRHTCTFNGQNPDRIHVASGAKTNFWTRVRNPQFGWLGVLGTWRSTSGNTFVIADRGRSFDIIMTAPSGAKSLIVASWIPGMEGTQFSYQVGTFRNVATRMPRDENQIRIESNNGTVNNWTRSAQQ